MDDDDSNGREPPNPDSEDAQLEGSTTFHAGTSHIGTVYQSGSGTVNIHSHGPVNTEEFSLETARSLLAQSLRHRETFFGDFSAQALMQANATFRLSMVFMAAGGIVILIAGVLALLQPVGQTTNAVALASGLSGAIVGASGAAFSVRSDRARKHLAQQAERMHSEILDERRFTQAAELLSGIRDPTLNDKTRAALALRILGAESQPSWTTNTSDQRAIDQP